MNSEKTADVVELNVGGVLYTTALKTLTRDSKSLLGQWFSGADTGSQSTSALSRDANGRYFIDRDGVLFRFVLDFLRSGRLTLPESFRETNRLRQEAEYYGLTELTTSLGGQVKASGPGLSPTSRPRLTSNGEELTSALVGTGCEGVEPKELGYIIVGYRGTFQFGRDGLTDVKFRKISRILVSGRVSICREVFGDTLNESRDPDRGTTDRYSARFFLKHSFIEQAFDALQEAGFRMVGSCASGTNSSGETKPGMDSEENRWYHYNEFVFSRP